MNYTKEQLEAMSDFEVNQALFEKLIPANCFSYEVDKRPDSESIYWNTAENEYVIDYCNNPNDIMSLAFERRIGISTYLKSNDWMVFMCDNSGKSFIDTNPLRAIACLLLMMGD